MATRDRTWANLPAVAQWLASQTNNKQDHAVLHKLAADLGQLSELLDKPLDAREPVPDRLVLGVNAGLLKLLDAYRERCQELKDVVHQENYHEIEAALSVPLLDASKREGLIANSRTITKKLIDGDARVGAVAAPIPVDFALHESLAKSVYGRLSKDTDLATVLLQLPERISKDLSKSLEQKDLARAGADLMDAAQLCRLVPGGLAAAVEMPVEEKTSPYAPPQGLRLLRVYQLLAAQAERTFDDHWYAKPQARELTYYIPTAQLYAASARKLPLSKVAGEDPLHLHRLKQITEIEAKVRQPAGLATRASAIRCGPPSLTWICSGTCNRKTSLCPPASRWSGMNCLESQNRGSAGDLVDPQEQAPGPKENQSN